VALTSVALNTISVAASYGLLVLVFQHTWAEDLFGLSMDYHVFVVSRIREAVQRGVPTRQAIEQGIVSSASTVSSAAIIMVAVFAIFATLSIVEFKQLGVGLAAAILIDATVIRAVVLPSLMGLLGDANWWAPRFLAVARPRGLRLDALQGEWRAEDQVPAAGGRGGEPLEVGSGRHGQAGLGGGSTDVADELLEPRRTGQL
jgi:uncharacterized membrane protein YdfJ with MMPL/SSD domain